MKTDNELIAEFMGLPLTKQRVRFTDGELESAPFQNWKYDSSWDWLMPVVEKCHQIGDQKQQLFYDKDGSLDDHTGWRSWNYRRVSLSTDIEQVHKSVVSFIKWYNETK